MLKEKNLAISVILSIVTCGIYTLIWMCDITNDVDNISQNPNKRSAGMVVLLTIITCGLYSFYWWYKNGELMEEANNKTKIANSSNGVLFLVLSLFSFSWLNYILIQLDINKYANNVQTTTSV